MGAQVGRTPLKRVQTPSPPMGVQGEGADTPSKGWGARPPGDIGVNSPPGRSGGGRGKEPWAGGPCIKNPLYKKSIL